MKIIATVEARMGSSRLPGKTLMEIEGKPLLGILLDRVRNSKLIDEIVVATSINKKDDVIIDFCKKNNYRFFRGSEDDVLDRVLNSAKTFKADIIVELTADNPLIDSEIIDKAIQFYLNNDYDYVCNFLPETFPYGSQIQVFSVEILDEVDKLTNEPIDRENVSWYIYHHPEKYKIGNLKAEDELSDPTIRITVDYEEDFLLIEKVIKNFKNHLISLRDVVKFINENPKVRELNKKYIK